MNSKQWTWIYQTLKKFFEEYQGRVPDDKIAEKTMELHDLIMDSSKKVRKRNAEADEQITNVMRSILAIVHSLKVEEEKI